MRNNNFKKFEEYGEEIDNNISFIQSKLVEFGNSPSGNPKIILKITRKMVELVDWLF